MSIDSIETLEKCEDLIQMDEKEKKELDEIVGMETEAMGKCDLILMDDKERKEFADLLQMDLQMDSQKANLQVPPMTKKRGKKRKSKTDNMDSKMIKTNENQKNSLMRLNEMVPGLSYIFEEQTGPAHDPLFKVSVEVNGEKFYGFGSSKQLAKHDAARAALACIEQNTDAEMAPEVKNENTTNGQSGNLHQSVSPTVATSPTKFDNKLQRVLSQADTQNPVKMLNELRNGLHYSLVKENTFSPSRRFVMCTTIDGNNFEAFGPSKKSAKAAVARSVLSQLYKVKFTSVPVPSGQMKNNNSLVDENLLDFPQNVADKIAKCIDDKYAEMMAGDDDHIKWKVLSGFVMTQNEDEESVEVVCFATGTKHLNGEYMSMNGGVVSDCHAEILSRRCLKDFFYAQLELHTNGEGDRSIFVKNSNGKFSLRENIKFHLFISTSPCGDARIFSVHNEEGIDAADNHPNRKARGLLRTKIESGEGTIPVKEGMENLTWDGILEGQQRYLNMSCSDKIASWNILGLQGSLLSNLIEPVYLESIILGRLFHSSHLYRALCGRFMATLSKLPQPYALHKPKMCSTTTLDIRQVNKSPSYSVNWTIGLASPEVINTKIGKLESGQISRLAKQSLFQKFCKLYKSLNSNPSSICNSLYSKAKKMNSDYVEAKQVFLQSFMKAGLGFWVKKPMEEEDFEFAF